MEETVLEVASGRVYFTLAWVRCYSQLRAAPTSFNKLLSVREHEVLGGVATGETSRAIALRLGLALRTIETFRYGSTRWDGPSS